MGRGQPGSEENKNHLGAGFEGDERERGLGSRWGWKGELRARLFSLAAWAR